MKTVAKVIDTQGEIAIIEIEKKSACEGCHKNAEGGCSVCTLLGDSKPMRSKAKNEIGAKVGDTVAVESETKKILWYAACVFLLPLIFAALGYLIAKAITEKVWVQTLGAALGFVLTFLGLRLWSQKAKKEICDVIITEIL